MDVVFDVNIVSLQGMLIKWLWIFIDRNSWVWQGRIIIIIIIKNSINKIIIFISRAHLFQLKKFGWKTKKKILRSAPFNALPL